MSATGALQNHGSAGLAVLAFKIQAQQFDLNRDLKFISMKDQLIRGRILVLAAREAGLIGPDKVSQTDGANVIVIGAGVGGVSAALMACELGLSVKLVESAPGCFPLLGLGSDRLFSATVYDWPHLHSSSHAFPFVDHLRDKSTADALVLQAKTLRFPKAARTSAELRSDFLDQLQQYQATFGASLDVMCEHSLASMNHVSINSASNLVFVKVQGPNGVRHLEGQILIFALGFGLDKDSKQTDAAKKFFSYCNLGVDVAKAQMNPSGGLVRIVGAGDGGLQEALRFVLDDAWHDLNRCVQLLQDKMVSSGMSAVWFRSLSRFQSAEDQALRSQMWGYTDLCIYYELDLLYKQQVAELVDSALPIIKAWREEVVRKGTFAVQLVDDCAYSMKAYGLNRFLTGLLEDPQAYSAGQVMLERELSTTASGTPDVVLERMGFAARTKQPQVGTADEDDLLRRIAFQSIPMNLDAVV